MREAMHEVLGLNLTQGTKVGDIVFVILGGPLVWV
jgi:hypothetical protein